MATPNRQPKYNESRRGDPRGRPKIKTIPQTADQNYMKGQPQGIAPTENPSQGIAPTKNPSQGIAPTKNP